MPRRFSPDRYASSRRNNRRDYNDYETYTAPRRSRYNDDDDTYTPRTRSTGDDTSARPNYRNSTYTARPSSNYYDDSNYEDYGEIGSNYDITSEPDYAEYEAEGYDEYDDEGYEPEPKAPRRLDFREAQTPRRNSSAPSRYGTAPSRLDFSNRNSEDLSKYMEYLERYDRGDIDNHDMSRVQRRFANSSFWDTFQPSRDMIQKYGNGSRSTRWPMFENKDGKWQPIIWRND